MHGSVDRETLPKPYGKLTAEQFASLMGHIKDLESLQPELVAAHREASQERLKELFDPDFSWAELLTPA